MAIRSIVTNGYVKDKMMCLYWLTEFVKTFFLLSDIGLTKTYVLSVPLKICWSHVIRLHKIFLTAVSHGTSTRGWNAGPTQILPVRTGRTSNFHKLWSWVICFSCRLLLLCTSPLKIRHSMSGYSNAGSIIHILKFLKYMP